MGHHSDMTVPSPGPPTCSSLSVLGRQRRLPIGEGDCPEGGGGKELEAAEDTAGLAGLRGMLRAAGVGPLVLQMR